MVLSVTVIAAVAIPIIELQSDGNHADIVKAKTETENLARRLVTGGRVMTAGSSINSKKGRTIASVLPVSIVSPASLVSIDALAGSYGKDPWGQPYHFQFLKNKLGAPAQLAVWSDGPSKIHHTAELKLSDPNGVEDINFDKSGTVISKVSIR